MFSFVQISVILFAFNLPYCMLEIFITTGYGVPLSYKDASLTVGEHGPILMEDTEFIDEMAHFDRERIPERVVHAKGGGAFGFFLVTKDITEYCGASLFAAVGKVTPIVVRFSTVAGEVGSADTLRDPRGFAIKFYTEEGNWDLVGNNLPVFFIRDPILFPSFIHTQKRDPRNFLKNGNMQWDFFTLRQEVTHMLMFLFSEKGTPDGFRFMDGFGVNTFKLINDSGHHVFCKFHYLSNQGIKNLTASKALELQALNPDYAIGDLYNAIEEGNYPSWTFYIQVMTESEISNAPFNPFDNTKKWPETDYPLIEVGRFTLNKNPLNYFAEIEQLAFSPSRMVPGIKPSPDKMLQGRLFSYPDTQRHRLGPNFLQIPVNCPYRIHNFQRDGFMTYNNQKNATNYHPNSRKVLKMDNRAYKLSPSYYVAGDIHKYDSGEEDNFSQAKVFYKSLQEEDKQRLAENLASSIGQADVDLQKRAVDMFANVSRDLKRRLTKELCKSKGFCE